MLAEHEHAVTKPGIHLTPEGIEIHNCHISANQPAFEELFVLAAGEIKQLRESHRLRSTKKVAYVNVYDGEVPVWFRETRELADQFAKVVDKKRIACVRIEYEDGQFDD